MRILAEPLALTKEKRKHKIVRRFLKWTVLVLVTFFLLTASIIFMALDYFLVDRPATPVEVYHNAWQGVVDNIYQQNKLKDWDKWEHKFDHLIKTDADAIIYARQMVKALGDPYTFILDNQQVKTKYADAGGKFIGVGVELNLELVPAPDANHTVQASAAATAKQYVPKIKNVLRGSVAEISGIFADDIILQINGKDTAGSTLKETVEKLKGAENSQIELLVLRNDQQVNFVMKRKMVTIPIVSTKILTSNNHQIGYLRIEGFDQLDTAYQVELGMNELTNCEALVIDVRDNYGGFIHTAVPAAAMFIKSGSLCNETVRVPQSGYLPFEVTVNERFMTIWAGYLPFSLSRHTWHCLTYETPKYLAGNRPIVILFNGGTASAGELFAAALKENRAAFAIGTETFGKGIGQTYIPIGNGARLNITNIHGLTPQGNWLGDGRTTVTNGLKPDLVCERKLNVPYGHAKDNQLNAALEFLNSKLTP